MLISNKRKKPAQVYFTHTTTTTSSRTLLILLFSCSGWAGWRDEVWNGCNHYISVLKRHRCQQFLHMFLLICLPLGLQPFKPKLVLSSMGRGGETCGRVWRESPKTLAMILSEYLLCASPVLSVFCMLTSFNCHHNVGGRCQSCPSLTRALRHSKIK